MTGADKDRGRNGSPPVSRIRRRRLKRHKVTVLALAALAVVMGEVGAGKLGDVLDAALAGGWAAPDVVPTFILGLALMVLFAAATALAWSLGGRLLRSHAAIEREGTPYRARGMIMALSFGRQPADRPDPVAACAALARTEADPVARLRAVCDPAGPFGEWSWQQPLRAVHANLDRLERVVLITSTETHAEFPAFRNALAALLPALTVEEWRGPDDGNPAGGVDLGDYNAVLDAIEQAIDHLADAIPERDICIDITGGIRIFPAAGAVASLVRQCRLTYIHPSTHKRLVYDARLDSGTLPR